MNEDSRWCNTASENGESERPRGPGKVVDFPGFLELVYGVLFEPGKTMEKAALNPPLVPALLVVTINGVLGSLMGALTASRVMAQSLPGTVAGQFFSAAQGLVVMGAIFGLFWSYVKWFGYSAIVHLAADLLGGRGRARGVFAAVGLAGLPFIFMIPVQFLAYWIGPENLAIDVLVGLAGLGLVVWSIVILAAGIKHVHGFSSGRSVLVIFTPVLALALLVVLVIAGVAAVAASIAAGLNLPGYF